MIRLLIICQLSSIISGQKIFDKFEKGRNNNYHSKETFRFDTVPDEGSYTILLESVEGGIEVRTHTGAGAEITIKRKIRAQTEKKAKELVESAKILVYHLEDNQLIQVRSENKIHYRRNVYTEFELKLPMNINLNLETIGGDIDVTDIRGESVFSTSGGDLDLKNLMGRIEAHTSGGNIEVSRLEGFIRVHTSGGNIRIMNSDGEFNASTLGGDLEFFQLIGNIDAQTSGGSITFRNIESESVKCRSSGGDIRAEYISANLTGSTSGGDIQLESIKGLVDVTTSGGVIKAQQITGALTCQITGGNIEGNGIIGPVDAYTTAGDIELELSYDTSIKDYSFNIETQSGDIGVIIPKRLQVNIESVLYGTKSIKKLNSEIPIKVVSYQNKVVGTGKIGGGLIPLILTTYSGSITINQD